MTQRKRKVKKIWIILHKLFLIFLLLIIVFPNFFNSNIEYIISHFNNLAPAVIPALTLIFIWHDNKKRDKQHLESISSIEKTSKIMIDIEKRDNIKRNIIAVANNIYSHRNSDLECGIKIIQGRDVASKDCNFAVTWDLSYQGNSSEFKKGDSYRFQIRIRYLSSDTVAFLLNIDDPIGYDTKLMSTIINIMEKDNNPSYYELRVNRHEGHYGEVLDGGMGVLSASLDGYRHLCGILGIIQSLDEDHLTQCSSIIDNHQARNGRLH